MKSVIGHIAFLLIFLGSYVSLGQNASDLSSRVAYQVALVQESKSADDIYIIKSRIDKLAQESRTYLEKKQIRDAYLLMSDKFTFYSHFKSGALVYFIYMDLIDQMHQLEIQAVKDSIQSLRNLNSSGGDLSKSPPSKSSADDENVIQDESSDEVISNSSSSDGNSSGVSDSGLNIKLVLGLTIIVIVILFIFWVLRKKITAVRDSLIKEQSDLKHLFRISANVSMLSGAIRYAREFSAHCAVVLNDLIEITKQNKTESKIDSSDASKAVSVFKRISSGENRSI